MLERVFDAVEEEEIETLVGRVGEGLERMLERVVSAPLLLKDKPVAQDKSPDQSEAVPARGLSARERRREESAHRIGQRWDKGRRR